MKKYIFIFLLSIISISGICQEMKIAVKAIPSAVLQSFRSAYPHAHIMNAAKETTKGEVVYEIHCSDAKKAAQLVLISTVRLSKLKSPSQLTNCPILFRMQ